MIPKVKQQVANWNQKDTKTEPKGNQNVQKNLDWKNATARRWKKKSFGATWSILASMLSPAGFLRGSETRHFQITST